MVSGAGGSVVSSTGGSVVSSTGGSVVSSTGGSVVSDVLGSVVSGAGGPAASGSGVSPTSVIVSVWDGVSVCVVSSGGAVSSSALPPHAARVRTVPNIIVLRIIARRH